MPTGPDLDRYRVPARATAALDTLVDRIQANPGDLINPHDFDDACLPDMQAVLAHLPPEVSEDDFVGILRLALLTECATESYANVISSIGRRFDASWLSRFTEDVWAPDEITHHTPYRLMLQALGFSDEELCRDIRETQEKQYVHPGSYTPVHITTFGMLQEYLTDGYHGLIANLLKGQAPEAAHMVFRVKKRETLHTLWYRDMTAIQIEANPHLVEDVATEILSFDMPGASLVPELQAEGKRWQQAMGINVEQVFRDLLRLVHEMLGSTRLTGELVLTLAARKNIDLGPISADQLRRAVNRLGGNGYGLIGEALLQKVGLGYLFERTSKDGAGGSAVGSLHLKIRALLRGWISDQIPAPHAVMLAS
jgi:hypothetical protein